MKTLQLLTLAVAAAKVATIAARRPALKPARVRSNRPRPDGESTRN